LLNVNGTYENYSNQLPLDRIINSWHFFNLLYNVT